jgi:predicted peroxiredoxin
MQGLRIIVLTADAERFRGALTVAAAYAALGGPAAILLQLDAVSLLRAPLSGPEDDAHRANGLPTLSALLDEALALGIGVIACQSGLALSGIDIDTLDQRIIAGGPVSFLQMLKPEERLLLV